MSAYETAHIASLLQEQNRLLAQLVEQGKPIETVEQLRKHLTNREFEAVQALRIADSSLKEVVETDAALKGYTNIDVYIRDELSEDMIVAGKSMQEIISEAGGVRK